MGGPTKADGERYRWAAFAELRFDDRIVSANHNSRKVENNADTKRRCSLKLYPVSTSEKSEWIVSGPSQSAGKRWRRKFENKELAEEFYKRELEKQSDQNEGFASAPINALKTGSPNELAEDIVRKITGTASMANGEGKAERRYSYGPAGYGYGKQGQADKFLSLSVIQNWFAVMVD